MVLQYENCFYMGISKMVFQSKHRKLGGLQQ